MGVLIGREGLGMLVVLCLGVGSGELGVLVGLRGKLSGGNDGSGGGDDWVGRGIRSNTLATTGRGGMGKLFWREVAEVGREGWVAILVGG